MPNFSSLAGLEVAEKFVWGGVGWFAQSFSCQTQPLCCVVLGLGFDNIKVSGSGISITSSISRKWFWYGISAGYWYLYRYQGIDGIIEMLTFTDRCCQ